MNSKTSILIAFLLNFFFAIFELIGGFFSKSVAIMSDALHDAGDALSIGISYFLEKKSERKANDIYTYGYRRYSVLGALITTIILICGSIVVIISSIKRLINPVRVNYNGMLILAIVGFAINFLAAYVTRDGDNVNKKAVNLHMMEDVLGWLVVLVGSIVIRLTKFYVIDSLMSLGVAIFLLIQAFRNLKEAIDLFLEKVPRGYDVKEITSLVKSVSNVLEVHHVHLWSMDGESVYATMHVVSDAKHFKKVKQEVKKLMAENNISHVTIELEDKSDECEEKNCDIKEVTPHHHHH